MVQIRVCPIRLEALLPDNFAYIENNGNYFLAGARNKYYIIDSIGYNLNTLESNGNYSLAEGGIYNQYYIFDNNGNSIGLTDSSGNPVSSNNGNSVVQAEEGPDGGFHVLWSGPQGIIPSFGPIMAWKVDASGQYQNHIYENIDYHETTFQVDLNGGGISTLSHDNNTGLTDISGNQNHIINNSIVLKNIHGTPVGPDSFGDNPVKWNAVQVEQNAAGGFEVMWIDVGSDTPLDPLAWKTEATGKYITHKILTDELRNAHESSYKVDLDGDGRVTLETNGSYELATSNNKYQIIDRSDSSVVTSFSKNSDGWSATQVEAGSESGTFEVFWSNGGRSGVTKINDNGKYQSTIKRTIDQHETVFQADLDGDNVIGLNLVSIETNGSYELATSHNQNYIIDRSDSSIVTNFVNSNMGNDWSATQVEASASGGFEVFWSHSDGRTTAHKISNSGVYESTITRTIVQHETVFQADLDGDNVIGLNLVSIETNGSYELATSHNKYYIIDRSDSSTVTNFVNSNMGNGWSATQVEASASGGFEVFWSHSDGRTTAHKISNSGVYESTITRTIDQHETVFQADLDGDNVIGLNLVSIETNGSYELATSNNKYQIIDRSDSSVVTSFSKNSDGWSATQVEAGSESGTFEVFWSNGGRSGVTKINDNGKYQSTIKRTIDQHETVFQADLDGDNVIGLNLVSIETNGSYELATSHNQNYIIDRSDSSIVTNFVNSNMGNDWSATQVEASASGGFEVFWSHSDGRTTAHKISNSGVYESTITRTIDQHETVFQADLDGDNVIGLNLVSIETNGSYELATSHNKYYIIDRSDSSTVTNFVNSNMGNGWSATQVEASASGGFEVFWSHSDGRTTAHKISNSGVYESTITRTIDQHETVFQADLDGDNVIGLNLVSIETNGSYELATSNNKYQIIDRSDSSVVTSFSKNSDGWSATQVEAGSESGTFEVFWSNGGRSGVTKINDNGKYQSTIKRTIDQHETVFQADLDGDNVIGLNLVSIETNGSYELATSHNQNYIIDRSDSSIVTNFVNSNMGNDWSATQVEASASGGFEVFWSHSDGRTTAHKISNSGVYESTITRTIVQHETVFQADLDGDNVIGLNLVSIETNGSYELATSHNKYYIIDRSDSSTVTNFVNSNMGNGWSATQVEASASGGFEVFWSHSDGRTTAHKISNSGVYESTITRTIDQHETVFQADLDGDNVIGLNLVSIETNGSYELATSNNKYQIIDRSDSSVVTSFSKNSDGWSATQVEAGSESGTFEVFWSNGGRSGVTKINDNGKYQSTIKRTIDQHETVFQADLDGDNVIGLNLVSIETNGSYELATSHNQYYIIDSNDQYCHQLC